MVKTGIIRRFDDLGRIIIPREVRKQIFGTFSTEGKMVEFFYEDGAIIMKPVSELAAAIYDAEIDCITDDQEFMETENEFIRNISQAIQNANNTDTSNLKEVDYYA